MKRSKAVLESKGATVSIPGGFQRRAIANAALKENDSEFARRDKLADSPTAWEPMSNEGDAKDRTVYFATNRAQSAAGTDGMPHFTADISDQLTVGKCVVNIPVQHRRGNLEQPSWWDPVDPAKHFLVESVQIMPQRELIREATSDDVLLYVHGFNADFDFAVLRAAQLKYDLQFPGTAMALCWPSAASADKYQEDRQRCEQSADQAADVLAGLIAAIDAHPEGSRPKLHILAHSMGNHLLLRAMARLQERGRCRKRASCSGRLCWRRPTWGRWSSTIYCRLCWSIRSA